MTEKLQFLPEESAYSGSHGMHSVQVKLQGGAPRTRKDFARATAQVQATWFLTREQYQIFLFFMRDTLEEGTQEFLADLALDFQSNVTYRCIQVAGSLKTTQIRGEGRRVTMLMEVFRPEFFQGRMSFNGTTQAIVKDQAAKDPPFGDYLSDVDQVHLVGADVVNAQFPGGRANLDGRFAISSVDSDSQITLNGADVINPNWGNFTTTVSSPVLSGPALVLVPT